MRVVFAGYLVTIAALLVLFVASALLHT